MYFGHKEFYFGLLGSILVLTLVADGYAQTITATATGDLIPTVGPSPNTNGDFTIVGQGSDGPNTAGNGIDDHTTWTFDFSSDPNFGKFNIDGVVVQADLHLFLTPRHPAITTDFVRIEGLENIESPSIQSLSQLPLGSFHEVNIDLLETYKSRDIIESFKNGQFGIVSMFYEDDAIVSFARLDLMSSDTSPRGQSVIWKIPDGGNGNLYELVIVPNGITWFEARDAANQVIDGHLATITSEEENNIVHSLIANTPDAWINVGVDTRGPWIGGFQTKKQMEPDEFIWVTGEPFNYSNWALSADGTQQPFNFPPNEDYVHFLGAGNNNFDSTWNDLRNEEGGGAPRGYILEVEIENSVLGDINRDGNIDLLDVAPFVSLLNSSSYQFEADLNSDCNVDLLDVLPFVEILSGN